MPLGNLRQQKSKIRPVKQPRPIPVKQPRPIPVKQTGPSIQLGIGPGGQPLPSPGMQQPANSFGEYMLRQQPAPGTLAEAVLRQQPGMAAQPASSALNDLMKRYAPFGDQPRDPNMFSSTPTRPPGMQQPGGFNPTPDIKYNVQPLPALPAVSGPLGSTALPDVAYGLAGAISGFPLRAQQPGMASQPYIGGQSGMLSQPYIGGQSDSNFGNLTAPVQPVPMQQQAPLQQPMQQTPMQQFSYGGRAGYQMGGGIMGLENDQDVFSRLENLNQNLDQVEQTLGTPYNNQSYGSPIFDALTGSSQMNLGGRAGYEIGGLGSLPMNFGQPLQVPQQPQPSFSSAQNITMNPLLNYGQPQLGGGTPLTMAGGGISRLGYQEGGMGMEMMQPQMQDPMMQPQMQQAPEGIMNAMPQEAGGAQQIQLGEGDNALLTIIQLLIEQGLDPETAQRVARQMLQAFAQGGEPAVEALADQFDQQMKQAPVMMATGGLTNLEQARQMLQNKAPGGEFLAYINPQEAAVLKKMGGAGRDINNTGIPSFIFKEIGKVVKSVFKSDIGKIALTIGATMLLGPAGAGVTGGMFGAAGLGASLTTNAFLAGAINAGAANLLVQGITTGKFNPKQALLASVLGGATGYFNPASAGVSSGSGVSGAESLLKSGIATPTEIFTSPGTLSSGVTGVTSSPTNYFSPTEYAGVSQPSTTGTSFSPMESQYAGQSQYTAPGTPPIMPQPNLIDRGIMAARQAGQYLSETGTNLMSDPFATIQRGVSSAYDYATKDPSNTILTGTALLSLAQQPNESDEEYRLRAQNDPRVAEYITQYGGQAKVYSPGKSGLYSMERAIDPFAGRNTFVANGGRIGYEYGSMPMGEPRRNQAGIMELDYRAKGGFVPPVGIKEKADDIPAMLSNNEFVFTADAVRNAGGGNVNKGAQKMYGLMKQLEAGGMA